MSFRRGSLTDELVDFLEAYTFGGPLLIGDGEAPKPGGWSEGQPGKGEFVPYAIVATGQASPNQRDPLSQNGTSWLQAYAIKAAAGSRQQADWIADEIREALPAFAPRAVDLGHPWKVQRVQYTQLGGVNRNDTVKPPYWEVVDSVSLWLEREP